MAALDITIDVQRIDITGPEGRSVTLRVRTYLGGAPTAVPFDLIVFKAVPAASPKRVVQREFVSVAYDGGGGTDFSVHSKSSGVGEVAVYGTGIVDVPFLAGRSPDALDYVIATPRYTELPI